MPTNELPTLGEAIRQALALRESIFLTVQISRHGLWLALTVVALAGLSQALGQSLVLFINHVRPRRFILAVLFAAVSYVLGYVLWTASVFLVGVYAFGVHVHWVAVAAAVGLSYAPQLFAFFELAPFLGSPIGIGLSLWSLVAILISLRGRAGAGGVASGGDGWAGLGATANLAANIGRADLCVGPTAGDGGGRRAAALSAFGCAATATASRLAAKPRSVASMASAQSE